MHRLCPRGLAACAAIAFTYFIFAPSQAQTNQNTHTLPFLTSSESQIKKNFAIFDSNKDNKVSRTEFRLSTGQLFFERDSNKDMFLTPDEIPSATPNTFKAADRDGDGKLTPYEFGEAVFMRFETYDLNKDGSITLEEVRSVVKTKQK